MLQCIINFCVCSRIHMCVHEHTKFSNTLQHIYFKSFIYIRGFQPGGRDPQGGRKGFLGGSRNE